MSAQPPSTQLAITAAADSVAENAASPDYAAAMAAPPDYAAAPPDYAAAMAAPPQNPSERRAETAEDIFDKLRAAALALLRIRARNTSDANPAAFEEKYLPTRFRAWACGLAMGMVWTPLFIVDGAALQRVKATSNAMIHIATVVGIGAVAFAALDAIDLAALDPASGMQNPKCMSLGVSVIAIAAIAVETFYMLAIP